MADRGAASPSGEWGRDAFKLEFSHGKVSRMVTLPLKLSDARTIRSIRSQGTCNFTLGDKIYYLMSKLSISPFVRIVRQPHLHTASICYWSSVFSNHK